jgi:hypothetical protein
MRKDDLSPRGPARRKAERKWRNNVVDKAFKEERAKPVPKAPKELEVGDVIENEKLVAEAATKFQTRCAKEIRGMLESHTRRNALIYKLSIRSRIHRLKLEKLKRLELREAQRVAQQNQETSNA